MNAREFLIESLRAVLWCACAVGITLSIIRWVHSADPSLQTTSHVLHMDCR